MEHTQDIGRLVLYCLLLCFIGGSSCIRCYYCDNKGSTACGVDFKAFQVETITCPEFRGFKTKCGKQRMLPNRKGWIGVIRSCYIEGDLPGINETDGCHEYYHRENNFTALYCFCSSSLCNDATPTTSVDMAWTLLYVSGGLLFIVLS